MSKDAINPDHYKNSCSLECIDVMRITFGDLAVGYFCLCNAFKYMWRYKNKNGEEDLQKAEWYVTYVADMLSVEATDLSPSIVKLHERLTRLLKELKLTELK